MEQNNTQTVRGTLVNLNVLKTFKEKHFATATLHGEKKSYSLIFMPKIWEEIGEKIKDGNFYSFEAVENKMENETKYAVSNLA